jgi:hypothetical protein
MNPDPSDNVTRMQASGNCRNTSRRMRAARLARAVVKMEASLQGRLTELERAAYLKFLEPLDLPVVEAAADRICLEFRPERTRIPTHPEFLTFYELEERRRREQPLRRMEQWRREHEAENADGSVDEAKAEFRRQAALIASR